MPFVTALFLVAAGTLVNQRMSTRRFAVTSSSDVAALRAAVANTNAKVALLTPLDDSELDRMLDSLRELAGQTAGSIDWVALRELYRKSAHSRPRRATRARRHRRWAWYNSQMYRRTASASGSARES